MQRIIRFTVVGLIVCAVVSISPSKANSIPFLPDCAIVLGSENQSQVSTKIQEWLCGVADEGNPLETSDEDPDTTSSADPLAGDQPQSVTPPPGPTSTLDTKKPASETPAFSMPNDAAGRETGASVRTGSGGRVPRR